MEWLKNKKNLPIVVGMAVFFLLAAGGLIAFELGLFPSGSSPTPVAPEIAGRGAPSPSNPDTAGSPKPVSPRPIAPVPAAPVRPVPIVKAKPGPMAPGVKTASAAKPVVSTVVDPAHGPDPFGIPGGQKKVALLLAGEGKGVYGMKAPLREILPPFDLFKPIAAAAPPSLPTPNGSGVLQTQAAHIVVSGIINGGDGISAILEVNGESQTVKPGDSLLDGSKVTSIQDTSVNITSASGTVTTIPLTSGQGDQGQNGAGNGAQPFNGPPQPFPNNN